MTERPRRPVAWPQGSAGSLDPWSPTLEDAPPAVHRDARSTSSELTESGQEPSGRSGKLLDDLLAVAVLALLGLSGIVFWWNLLVS